MITSPSYNKIKRIMKKGTKIKVITTWSKNIDDKRLLILSNLHAIHS